jgi:hypothetical protein
MRGEVSDFLSGGGEMGVDDLPRSDEHTTCLPQLIGLLRPSKM